MKTKLKLGCDPEFFATEKSTASYDEGFYAGVPFAIPPVFVEDGYGVRPVGGTDIKHPLYINTPIDSTTNMRIVGDGVAFELNFNRPHNSPEEMYDAVVESKSRLSMWLSQFGLGLWDKPLINFDYRKYWKPGIEDDPRYKWSIIFGCDPDVDAFNVGWLCTITDASKHPSRYGGGHIHMSGHPLFAEHPLPTVQLLALTVGNYCITKAHDTELEKGRAKYYGKPGKHRVQKYSDGSAGIEYRTPSNQWTTWTKKEFVEMFDWVDVTIKLLENPAQGKAALQSFGAQTVEAITKVNKEKAAFVLSKLG